jgi:hypothetical protein
VSRPAQKQPLRMLKLSELKGKNLTVTFQTEQFRFPRSKKVRIRNKWSKDKRNWRVPKPKPMLFRAGTDWNQLCPPRGGWPVGRLEYMPLEYETRSLALPIIDKNTGVLSQLIMKEGSDLHTVLGEMMTGRRRTEAPTLQ